MSARVSKAYVALGDPAERHVTVMVRSSGSWLPESPKVGSVRQVKCQRHCHATHCCVLPLTGKHAPLVYSSSFLPLFFLFFFPTEDVLTRQRARGEACGKTTALRVPLCSGLAPECADVPSKHGVEFNRDLSGHRSASSYIDFKYGQLTAFTLP